MFDNQKEQSKFELLAQIKALHLLNIDQLSERSKMLPIEDATRQELYELGIFVHDYELYTASQLNYILPILKNLPRPNSERVIGFAA
jgi:hypothetical protein